MPDVLTISTRLPPGQEAIRARCFHPSGVFVEFKKQEIEQSIPDRFEQMVRKYPGRIAVKTRNHTLTYSALNKAANRVARAILARRGEGEEPIALLLEKGASLIAAIIGVLKAGKICVALDPSFPYAGIDAMLKDSQAGLLVTNNRNASTAGELAQNVCQWINFDELDPSPSTENPGLFLSPETLACILYTSGSTGEAKGVVQNHRNVLHNTMKYTNGIHICAEDRLSLLPSCSVAASMSDIYGALLNGATLFPLSLKDELVNLADWLIQEEITIYHSVPTVFRHFIGSLSSPVDFPKLRLIKLGGETVSKRDVELYKRHFSNQCVFHNGLGSTEMYIIRQYFMCKETELDGNVVPVGNAVDGTEVLLLDENGNEVGFNQVGEIAIKSRYLPPGYWRRPDLTLAKFLLDPNSGDERIYLSGDLGRMLPDGCLEHLGRKDSQVKIRGFKVEVAEVELSLLGHPAIKEAVVLAREDKPDDRRLVAYVLQPAPTVSELRNFLKEKLPDYMVPSVFVFLDALPLTLNGKVDRLALPIPGHTRPELAVGFKAPRTQIEDILMGFWAEALGLDKVGIHDNFFELGGNSLLVTQVIPRINDAFNVNLSLGSLYETPTVAELAITVITVMQSQAE